MTRRPPRSTLSSSSAASDVYKRQLRLDGVTIHHLAEEFKDMGKKKKRHATKSIVDYADERIVSFEELEPEERTYCSMLSNLVLGVPLVVVALCISFL